ncbi:MAG: hypothetical protein ACHQ4H_14180 [Ktedonobacterales bacterium]
MVVSDWAEQRPHGGTRRGGWRAALALGLVCLAASATLWLTLVVWRSADFDVPEYVRYARAFWLGQPRFLALPQEYPPPALLVFGLPLLLGTVEPRLAFGVCMAVMLLLGYIGFRRYSSTSGGALRYVCYLLLGAQGTLLARYDLVPALATVAALWATRRRHFALAYTLLGAGAALKLYPAALIPIVAIAQWRDARARQDPSAARALATVRRRSSAATPSARLALAASGLLLALCAAVCVLAARAGATELATLTYAFTRPVQIESLPATFAWLGTIVGIPLTHLYAYGSDGVAGPLASAASWWSLPLLAAGCLLVYALTLAGKLSVERAFLACVCVLLLTAKVFSTQYLIWVLPLAAEAGGDEVLWLVICALTFADYPLYYPFNHDYTVAATMRFLALLALRNALFVLAAVRALRWRWPNYGGTAASGRQQPARVAEGTRAQ